MKQKMKYLITLALSCIVMVVSGQKTMTIEQCEDEFRINNLELLAEQFNIDYQKAAIIQAKIWERPVLTGQLNFYNPEDKRFLDIGRNGSKDVGVEQLIYLGSKKKNEIELAKSNAKRTELYYQKLLRDLRLELQRSFYELYFNENKLASVSSQIAHLDTLINAYRLQTEIGNVPLKDLVRLQSLVLSFRNDLSDIQREIFEEQNKLKLLLGSTEAIQPEINIQEMEERLESRLIFTDKDLWNRVLQYNPDLLISAMELENSKLKYKLEKSLSVPDITVGANYSQIGGAYKNEANITVGLPLPLWNDNKGNIRMAEAEISKAESLAGMKELQVKADVSTALDNFKFLQEQYISNVNSTRNLESIYEGMLANFQKGNVSMIEFTDFMESYNQNILFLNEQKKQVIVSGLMLNYLVGSKIF